MGRDPLQPLRRVWRHAEGRLQGSQAIHRWVDPVFYARQVGELPEGLSAAAHYLRHGWREGRQPHPLFDPGSYQQACIQAGLGTPKGPPLLHFCRHGARAGVLCSPLFEPNWWSQANSRRHRHRALSLSAVHPLGGVALLLRDNQEAKAAALLRHWQIHGLSPEDRRQITRLSPVVQPITTIPLNHRLALLQTSPLHWSTHAWLQRLPVKTLAQLENLQARDGQPSPKEPTTLVLAPQPLDAPSPIEAVLACWAYGREAEQLIVIDPSMASLLHAMGLTNVYSLSQDGPLNGWLDDDALLDQAEEQLGLPAPTGLTATQPVVLGDAGPSWQASLSDQLIALPGWEYLIIDSKHQARAQAAWLHRCARLGHPLVLLNPSKEKRDGQALMALQADALALQGDFSESALLDELNWYQQGCPEPVLEPTPQPSHRTLWQGQPKEFGMPEVSVCISLHNYSHTIERALASVRAQSLDGNAIELLVVDDASSDSGASVVQAWMERHGHHFHSCTLIQHTSNGGLAAARNTAFEQAKAAWCFVLDADNLLHSSALEALLAIAERSGERAAVVHPWIAREEEQGDDKLRKLGLHGIAFWQRERFLHGNHIDAMALVRRAAWQAVGGYTHIPGGWEDFDFWCCLIEAGWHGVCLPQTVCSYVVHNQSMLATQTNANLRRLGRLLQHRHPWLELDLSNLDPGGGAHPI